MISGQSRVRVEDDRLITRRLADSPLARGVTRGPVLQPVRQGKKAAGRADEEEGRSSIVDVAKRFELQRPDRPGEHVEGVPGLRPRPRPDRLPEAARQGEDGQVRGAVQSGAEEAVRGRDLHGPAARRTSSRPTSTASTTEGEPYLVMEWIEGLGLNYLVETQSAAAQRQPRSTTSASSATPSQYMHDSKYLHRDLCPRNVMVDQGGRGQADRLRPDDPVHAASSAQPGNRTGTADYLAPEIIKRQTTDHRVDLFALGVTAYEVFTGAAAVGAVAVERGDAPQAPEHPAAGPEGPEPGPGRGPVRDPAQGHRPRADRAGSRRRRRSRTRWTTWAGRLLSRPRRERVQSATGSSEPCRQLLRDRFRRRRLASRNRGVVARWHASGPSRFEAIHRMRPVPPSAAATRPPSRPAGPAAQRQSLPPGAIPPPPRP